MTTENATEPSTEDTSGLKNKNAELKRERDDWKKRAEAAEAEKEELADKATAGDDLARLQREYKKLEKSLNDITEERDALANDLRSTRVEGAISAAIASGNVRPEMVEAVEAILHRKASYEDGEATIDGKSIADFAKSYFAKDGAHFVRADDNSGGDATGNDGSKSVDYSTKPFALGDYQTLRQSNPEAAAAWAEASGNGYLNKSQ